jgi:hypothetical protein
VPRTQVGSLWNCIEDGSRPPEVCLQGPASNHLSAAALKRCGGERLRKRRPRKTSGEYREDERKRTVVDASKGPKKLSKPRAVTFLGSSLKGTCLRFRRQPVSRRHEPGTGFDMERGNLVFDGKGNDKWAVPTRKHTDAKHQGRGHS